MPVRYSYDADRRVLVYRTADPVTDGEWQTAWAAVQEDATVPLASLVGTVLDFRRRREFQSGNVIRSLVMHVAPGYALPRSTNLAIVVSDMLGHGVARMIGTYASDFAHVEIFRDMAAALDWLQQQRPPEDPRTP